MGSVITNPHRTGRLVPPFPDLSCEARLYDDFMSGVKTAFTETSGAGTGVSNASGVHDDASHPGVARITTGSTASGITGLGANWARLPGGEHIFESCFEIPVLSTASEEFVVLCGFFGDSVNGAPTHSSCIIYDRTANTNFLCRTSNGGTATTTDSGIAVSATTYYKCKVVINAAHTKVDFYIDDVLVASHTANLPDLTDKMYAMTAIAKSVGTSESFLDVDFVDVRFGKLER